jgi:hypothetical protein
MKADRRREMPALFEQRRIRCVQVVGQHIQPLIQELVLQEADEALRVDRAEYPTNRYRPSASDGSTKRSSTRNSAFSSMSCAGTEQQRTAL